MPRIPLLLISLLAITVSLSASARSENARISGQISSASLPLEYVTVQIEGTALGGLTDAQGRYEITDVPLGEHTLIARSMGYAEGRQVVIVSGPDQEIEVDMVLEAARFSLDQIVVTGTKTFKRQTDSPVIVNVLDRKALERVQACTLSDALNFQPGLRVETNCQTCNYTQLRMNGLGGGYSQILINGRPLFSPLTGLYGMEQIPANMIDRIETVRGGGSSLYGSSAIGGTVNIITRLPIDDAFEFSQTYQNINGGADDFLLSGNAQVVSDDGKIGASIFINNRRRGAYDHNGDGFSELPELKNNSFGSSFFWRPDERQKLEVSIGALKEYRYGGELVEGAAHLASQSEERRHDVYMMSADYQINSADGASAFITYASYQSTDRDHYTGVAPDAPEDLVAFRAEPPYGFSKSRTAQVGLQLNRRLKEFPLGQNTLTLGAEMIVDDIYDEIRAYDYEVDQLTENAGIFLQSDWSLTPTFDLLSGVRMDTHNLLDGPVFSPRVSMLYKWRPTTQLRLTYSTGFRAPQAFDADLHIAFAGGGVSRIGLDPDLIEERSQSWSASINYDRPLEKMIFGFTAEAFYTYLDNAFFQEAIGEDEFGERFEKRNGQGATVQGLSIEGRLNYDRMVQIEGGVTVQSSQFDAGVIAIDGLAPVRRFLRTPDDYGYATLSLLPEKRWSTDITAVYTGEMLLAHLAGAPEQAEDEFVTTPSFVDLGLKMSYQLTAPTRGTRLVVFAGVRNLMDSYQEDFDSGKDRDSNYVYGPALPRTVYFGLRLGSQ